MHKMCTNIGIKMRRRAKNKVNKRRETEQTHLCCGVLRSVRWFAFGYAICANTEFIWCPEFRFTCTHILFSLYLFAHMLMDVVAFVRNQQLARENDDMLMVYVRLDGGVHSCHRFLFRICVFEYSFVSPAIYRAP